jgi:hypothetical protein
MIHLAIRHLAQQLNQFLRRTHGLNEDIVLVSNLVNQDGAVAPDASNKLVMFLANIEKDSMPIRLAEPRPGPRVAVSSPPLYLNLYVMVAANFTGNNYPEALKFISSAIGFFQRQAVFDHQNSPDLDPRIDKLILDVENLKIQDLSNLWGLVSGKYLPSILYRVRLIPFDTDDVVQQVPIIRGLDVNA